MSRTASHEKLSFDRGYDGFLVGEAMDEDLYYYYMDEYGAQPLPIIGNNPYRLMFPGYKTKEILEVYSYEETNETL